MGPVLLGQALVVPGHFSLSTAVLCLACALALQLAVNLANDLFDGLSGVDQPDRLGPTRALQAGWLSAGELRAGLAVTLGIAIATGLWLTLFGHWLLWLLGGLALLGVLGYSGGKRPYANRGLGELAVCFFGPVAVLGSLLAQRVYPFLPARWLARFSHATESHVGGITAPLLVIHSRDDEIIPFAEGEAVYRAARDPKRLLEIRGGHNTGFLERSRTTPRRS